MWLKLPGSKLLSKYNFARAKFTEAFIEEDVQLVAHVFMAVITSTTPLPNAHCTVNMDLC